MSNFFKLTFHPEKKRLSEAEWLEDYFGRSLWGIRFINEEYVYRMHEINKAESEHQVEVEMEEDDDDDV